MTIQNICAIGFVVNSGDENNKIDADQVSKCQDFLSSVKKGGSGVDSYYLKSVVERVTGEYISNGALISAAIALGFKVSQSRGSPNARISISKAELKRLEALPKATSGI